MLTRLHSPHEKPSRGRRKLLSFQQGVQSCQDRRLVLKSIQSMRGLAALMVVAFHLALSGAAVPGNEHGGSFLSGGVDIFFVISGFVMVVSTTSRKPAFSDFLTARLVRVAPLYILATLLCVCAHRWLLHGTPRVWEFVLSCLFIPYTNSINHQPVPILGVGWTLDYEMFFYLAFGATLVLRRKAQLWSLAAIFVFLVALRPAIGQYNAAFFRFTSPLFFEFLAGAVLGVVMPRLHSKSLFAGFALIVSGFVLGFGSGHLALSLPRTISFGVPAIMIVAGSVLLERVFASSVCTWLVFIGNASYSIYLFHFIPMVLLENSGIEQSGAVAKVSVFLMAVATGVVAHFLLERPLLQMSRAILRRVRAPATAMPRVAGSVLP